jgi:ectoine hydroxylase-related dioxygenase (phytanoyl-CoA dioxygenase family)
MVSTAYDLAKAYPIDADQCAHYRRAGHILLRNVATAEEIEYHHALIVRLVDSYARTHEVQLESGLRALLHEYLANVWRRDEELKEFVLCPRFARVAAELMGVSGVRLYHDEAIVKEPGGHPAPWHKDHFGWPLATHQTIKMWLALADISCEMSAISFATGSQHAGLFPEVRPSYESNELFKRIIHDHRIPVVSYSMNAGDAIFFSGEILHSTQANTSSKPRQTLAIIYFADGTRVMKPNHEHRQADLEEFLPGLAPGDLAAGDLNPLLYPLKEGL